MPNYYVRANLASAIFPFYTQAAGRTIIVPQSDENFDRYNAANTVPDKGVPQVFYMHNVMPISGGYQSVGYTQLLAPADGNQMDFDQAFAIKTPDLNDHILVPAGGTNYIYTGNNSGWISLPFTPGLFADNGQVTTAYVQGQTYICYEKYGTFIYDNINQVLTQVTLTGLDDSQILGICAAAGYLLAYTKTTVFWSSVTTPTDFTPSIQTGAGNLTLTDAKGGINFCLQISNGFIVYCGKNVLGATYTSNTQYPFLFAEVPDSGGCDSPDKVAWQSNIDTHLAYTTSGIQLFNKSNATGIMPEFADLLASQLYEDYDEATDVLTTTYLTNQVFVKMYAVSERFLIMSYGPDQSNFTYAVIMDTVLNRYGRLKITHRACFEYNNPAPYGELTYGQLTLPYSALSNATYGDLDDGSALQVPARPKKTLSFLQQDGTIVGVDFDLGNLTNKGVFLLGKFQHVRNNVITHQKTDVESVELGSNFSISVVLTLDGKTLEAPLVTTPIQAPTGRTGTWACRATGVNFSLLCKGSFNLTSIVLQYTIGGSR